MIVNTKFWNGLPPDVRKQLEMAMNQATKQANTQAEQENAKALLAVQRSGTTMVHFLTDKERAAWQEALLPVHKAMEPSIGKETIDAVKKEIGRNRR